MATKANQATILSNVAAWHIQRVELAQKEGRQADAERHDTIAFRLFLQARALRVQKHAA